MKTLSFLLIFIFSLQFINAQEQTFYKYGQNGIELISKVSGKIIVISTYNAKMTIKDEIARIFYAKYINQEINDNTIVELVGTNAKVVGKIEIKIVRNLISVNFYYQTIYWNDGLIEVHKQTS